MFLCNAKSACSSLCFSEPVSSAASNEVILNLQEAWLGEVPSSAAVVAATTQDTGLVLVEPQAWREEVPSIAALVAAATHDTGLVPVEPQPLSFGDGSAIGVEVAEVSDANDSRGKDDARVTAKSMQLGKSLRDETSDCIMGSSGVRGRQGKPPMLLGRRQPVDDDPEHLQKVQDRADEARRHQLLRAFLVSSGFTEVNGKKNIGVGSSPKSFSYPLHTAVTANNEKAVEVLLWAGADKSLADSSVMTPLALARNLDTEGSHKRIIELLVV